MSRYAFALALAASLIFATTASANRIVMPNLAKTVQAQRSARAVNPPPPPCPQYPTVSCTPVPEAFATTLPFPGNMAYYGGQVETTPHIYVVYWGWGETGAWPAGTSCSSTTFTEGTLSTTLPCDPD